MGKDIQMGEDLMITDEMREKFRLNEDPESEEPLRRPVRWRHLFPASLIKQAAGDAVQSRIEVTGAWRNRTGRIL